MIGLHDDRSTATTAAAPGKNKPAIHLQEHQLFWGLQVKLFRHVLRRKSVLLAAELALDFDSLLLHHQILNLQSSRHTKVSYIHHRNLGVREAVGVRVRLITVTLLLCYQWYQVLKRADKRYAYAKVYGTRACKFRCSLRFVRHTTGEMLSRHTTFCRQVQIYGSGGNSPYIGLCDSSNTSSIGVPRSASPALGSP